MRAAPQIKMPLQVLVCPSVCVVAASRDSRLASFDQWWPITEAQPETLTRPISTGAVIVPALLLIAAIAHRWSCQSDWVPPSRPWFRNTLCSADRNLVPW
jgi:predicted component of type VI protein secretion system